MDAYKKITDVAESVTSPGMKLLTNENGTLRQIPIEDFAISDDVEKLSREVADLKENGASVAVDDTLTQTGMAADAAIVGEKVNQLSEAKVNFLTSKNAFMASPTGAK